MGICGCFCPFDEPQRQAEAGAEFAFAVGHAAIVGLVIESGEVKQAVENKDLEFAGQCVARFGSLAARCLDADGEIAGVFFLVLD
jgi:hypothetical protein